MGLPGKPPNTKTPTNLMEVLEEVEETEKRAVALCLQIVKSWDPPKKKTQPPLNPSEKFEQVKKLILHFLKIHFHFIMIYFIFFNLIQKKYSIIF